jgi:copper resistance protein B
MHITKHMKISFIFTLGFSLSSFSLAMDVHDHAAHPTSVIEHDHSAHQMNSDLPQHISVTPTKSNHDHKDEHGGQIYSSVVLDQSWRFTDHGHSEFHSENELKIGTDEKKFVLQLDVEKPESARAEYDAKFLYSRMIADFWDVQFGVGYQDHQVHVNGAEKSQDHLNAVFGIAGLAPYFFETSAYVYVGKDDYIALNLEAERDVLITQKWIIQPYFELDAILNDNSKYAERTGIHEASIGFEMRYEVSKQFMPYLDIAYRYEQETEWENNNQKTHTDQDWMYGVGVRLNF